ncbi:MAG: MMPL family transporter [Thermoguttaceae bacterium]
MSAEGKPQADPSLLGRPLELLARLVTRFPLATLAVAILGALVSLVLSGTQLGFRTSRADLLNPRSEFNRRWLAYTQEFTEKEDLVVVVEGESREAILPVIDEVYGAIVRETNLFEAVLHEVDLSKIRAKGLYYLEPAELQQINGFLDKVTPILQGDWAQLSLANLPRQMMAAMAQPGQMPGGPAAAQAELSHFTASLLAALDPNAQYQSPWPDTGNLAAGRNDLQANRRFLTADGRLGFVLLRVVKQDTTDFIQNSRAIDVLKRTIDGARSRHPEVQIGATGLPVIEHDEMQMAQSSTTKATLVSLVGVALVFIAGFGGLRHPLMANAALLCGMAWAFGYATLAIGHLSILSSAFAAILIGQGLDFGVYYLARYLQARQVAPNTAEAIAETARSVGPGITTGAVSTAIAFFTASFTDFTGVAELGIISGAGILLCWLAALTLLPAMIQISDGNRSLGSIPSPLNLDVWLQPLFYKPRLTLVVFVVGTLGLSFGLTRLWYDYNLLNMQPVGLESVKWERELLTKGNQSAFFALSMTDSPEDALARKARFLSLPCVDRVEEIASMFPPGLPQKQPLIHRIHERLVHLPPFAPELPLVAPADLDQILSGMENMTTAAGAVEIGGRLRQIRDLLRRIPPHEYYRRLSAYPQTVAADLLTRLAKLRTAANPEPPQLADVPPALATRFVGRSGKHLLKVYGKGDIWDVTSMEQFVQAVRSVDTEATGNPMQVYEAAQQMKGSYQQAAWYAFLTVVPVVFLDFRSIRYTLLALLPLGMAMIQMFGLMGLLNVPLNPANMIVLPLILGIGIDNGVHIVHDFRQQTGRYRLSASTANAVVINSLGNMVGFGSLMVANHQGLQSLGRVLTIGMGCSLFSALVMPNLFILWRGHGTEKPSRDDVAEPPTDLDLDYEPEIPAPHIRQPGVGLPLESNDWLRS